MKEDKSGLKLREVILFMIILFSMIIINENQSEHYFLSEFIYEIFKMNIYKILILLVGVTILENIPRNKAFKILLIPGVFSALACGYHLLHSNFYI
ncbi:hypothetical protein [Aureivirga sp. CE67]|uniref:hypothetical protein n=1 Tax=Aureivirga sp. CE67 TaxID=1788983 RepID=UPI0018CB9221|nr:hypothetical protein [Aureivirga sp. CE67]